MVVPPRVQVMSSISFNTTGSRPLTHNTMPNQAIQDIERSSAFTQGAVASATCNTLTPTRMTTNDTSTGMTTLKTAKGTYFNNAARAM